MIAILNKKRYIFIDGHIAIPIYNEQIQGEDGPNFAGMAVTFSRNAMYFVAMPSVIAISPLN